MLMHAVAPLSDTNPELLIFEAPGAREYRIENWRLSRVGNKKVIDGAYNFDWQDIPILVMLVYLKDSFGHLVRSEHWRYSVYGSGALKYYLSVVIFPPHGIQLESRHGLPLLPLFTRRLFIPFTTLHDVLINEGLRRWDVRYYLAIIQQAGPRSFVIEVAYKVELSVLDGKLPVTNNLVLRI